MASTAASASTYLVEKNFKSLIEWMTAQVLFSRPEDPLQFVANIVGEKLAARTGGYSPEDADKFLSDTYDTPHVAAVGGAGGAAAAVQDFRDEALEQRIGMLEKVISASRTIAMQLDPAEATRSIITESCDILKADRATLFRLDNERRELELLVAEGADSIFVPLGKGIAGTVAATGETVNIPDAYLDERFDSSHDTATGFRTTAILCAPVRDGHGAVVGVVQAINKTDGTTFTALDEEIIGVLASQAGIALKNAALYFESMKAREKVSGLLEVLKAMHSNLGLNSLLFTVTSRAPRLVDADRCTMFLVNHHAKELWAMQGEVDIRIPMDKGIAGAVATTGKTVNVPDAYAEPRFNQEIDKASGFRTRTILAMAATGKDGKVLAVLQLINKQGGPFTPDDEEIVASFLDLAAPIIEHSQLFQTMSREEPSGNEFTGRTLKPTRSAGAGGLSTMAIEEGDEDEEEDDDE